MKIYAITNQKGGVGKSTTAHAVGVALAHQGRKVLLIDLDEQGDLSFIVGAKPGPGSFELLTKAAILGDVTQETQTKGLYIVPGAIGLASLDLVLKDVNGNGLLLKEALKGAKYDYIIIDVPPGLGSQPANALNAADALIIPAQANILGLKNLNVFWEKTIKPMKKTNKALKVAGILFTSYKASAVLSKAVEGAFNDLAQAMGAKVFKSRIRNSAMIEKAQAGHKAIFEYSKKNAAGLDYLEFVEELKRTRI